MRWVLALAALVLCSCTIDVGQPVIDIKCVEVDFPGEKVTYCDGAVVTPPPSPSDAGKDSGG